MKNKHTKPMAELKAQATDWAKLDAVSDTEIDYSDIPKLGDEFFKEAVRNPFYRPIKAATTVHLDTDILIRETLKALIQRESGKRLVLLGGSEPTLDYISRRQSKSQKRTRQLRCDFHREKYQE